MPRSNAVYLVTPARRGGNRWLRHRRDMPGWGRHRWCCSTSQRCTSKPMPVTGSVEPGFSGFSKERRLEPQITLGLLTDASGFPLTVEAFEGNKAETATM